MSGRAGESRRDEARRIWTVGHSNHELAAFLELLQSAEVRALADVRRFPGSRRQPQFQQDALRAALADVKIAYRHFPELGGRRQRSKEKSPNRGWRVAAFQAYADYMLTDEFAGTLGELEGWAKTQPTAMMCAEAVPWRCHRRLIADALLVRGWRVFDILAKRRIDERKLTDFAQYRQGRLTYPEEDANAS